MDSTYPDFFTENIKKDLNIKDIEDLLPHITNRINTNLIDQMSGPLRLDSSKEHIIETCIDYNRSIARGYNHIKINQYQVKHGDLGLSSNIQIPIVEMEEETNTPVLRDIFIISHPDDCEKIAKQNIKKLPNFKPIVADSIISTTDNDHWRDQRNRLGDAFLPNTILKNVFKYSNVLARNGVNKLRNILGDCNNEMDINDFLLDQTQEQLQKVLLGMDDEFVNKTNKPIRNSFNGKERRGYTREFAFSVLEEIKKNNNKFSLNSDQGVYGPVSNILGRDLEMTTEKYGNIVLLAFAGHDTTGHTLTWLLYELSKNIEYQNKLRKEIDKFWDQHDENSIQYDDLRKLPYMTKCIHETLRLWPAVANGTFRELENDTFVHGHNNQQVLLPKGSYTQIFTWSRHRNKRLWGKDAECFNPDREWTDNEIWNSKGFAAYNPSSRRFSPFSYGPRDCLGKNFAQMEMRLILLYLVKNFVFYPDQTISPFKQIGFNRATLAPINLNENHIYPDTLLPILETGCYLQINNRYSNSKL